MPELPHVYPFRLVEPGNATSAESAPRVTPSAGGALFRPGGGAARYPLSLAIEAMAQAAILDPPEELRTAGAAQGRPHLAGIEHATLLEPIHPGDRLEAHAELAGRFGPAAKLRCYLEREGERVAEATLLIALGTG